MPPDGIPFIGRALGMGLITAENSGKALFYKLSETIVTITLVYLTLQPSLIAVVLWFLKRGKVT